MPYVEHQRRFMPRTLTAGDSNESNIRLRASDNGRVVATNMETAVSGAHGRAQYRGGTIMHVVEAGVPTPFYVTRGGVSQDDMLETRWPATNANSTGLGAKIGLAHRRIQNTFGTSNRNYGWYFGEELMQY
jgi:hypothetical protein